MPWICRGPIFSEEGLLFNPYFALNVQPLLCSNVVRQEARNSKRPFAVANPSPLPPAKPSSSGSSVAPTSRWLRSSCTVRMSWPPRPIAASDPPSDLPDLRVTAPGVVGSHPAPATTDVDSGPWRWRITGGCASSLLSQSATADIPGTNPRRMINAYPFMTSRPCISTVCIHANNILVVMTIEMCVSNRHLKPRAILSGHATTGKSRGAGTAATARD